MPITSQWWTFSDGMISSDREEAGVYELGNDSGTVVYIGSSNALRRRLKEHLDESGTTCIKKNTKKYRLEYVSKYKERERELYDEHVRINGKPPICNDMRP